jgi:hypothetical protein
MQCFALLMRTRRLPFIALASLNRTLALNPVGDEVNLT